MTRRPSLIVDDPQQTSRPPVASLPESKPKSDRKAAREGKRGVVFWVSREAYQELQVATKRMETTIQAAGEEMLTEWFRRHAIKAPPV